MFGYQRDRVTVADMAEDDLIVPETPCKDDVLFRGDLPDGMNNACINFGRDGGLYGYTEGYRRGALLLVEHVIEKGRSQDFLVYPIIFLYRHHIELALKNLLRQLSKLLPPSLSAEEKKHLDDHRLDLLWQDVKPRVDALSDAAGIGRIPANDIEGIENYIEQLHEVDPRSFSFRYTHTKKGDASLPSDLTHINLRHFAELIERLADYLDNIKSAATQYKEDMVEAALLQTEMEAH